jgi:hypothetical protein
MGDKLLLRFCCFTNYDVELLLPNIEVWLDVKMDKRDEVKP